MTYRKESNSEKGGPAYPGLEAARAKLAGVLAQLQEVDSRLEEAVAIKREHEANRDSILARAELILEGGEALPERDIAAEVRTLFEKRAVLTKAAELQQARVDEAAREAAAAEYKRLKPSYYLETKKLLSAVEAYRAAVEGMAKIREGMAANGLACGFPAVNFPGWSVDCFEKKRETLGWTLKQQGIEILK